MSVRLGGGPSIQVRYGGICGIFIFCEFPGGRTVFRLGGDRSIQLSYGGLYRKYSILKGSRIRTIRFLGGDRSIRLSYRGILWAAGFGGSYFTRFCPGCQRRSGKKPPGGQKKRPRASGCLRTPSGFQRTDRLAPPAHAQRRARTRMTPLRDLTSSRTVASTSEFRSTMV